MPAKKADVGAHYLEVVKGQFEQQKRFAERAFEQLDTEDFHKRLGDNTNTIYAIVKHLAGNFKSRFTDFLTSDGEKATRDRDGEFVDEAATKDEIMRLWEEAWAVLLKAVGELGPGDLMKTVTIRGEAYTVLGALNRSIAHVNHHTGQVMLLARHWKGAGWKWLTIAPGESRNWRPAKKSR